MLEKIGLPPKPSLRGNNWVVDASHCQGCSSQFSFINRKHHCRRCGGLFCNSCTQQRMYLRGQGDSPVRICEPCKKLEEAARFEMRHGHKNRAGRGGLKLTSEDEVLSEILGHEGKELVSSGQGSTIDMISSIQRATSNPSSSGIQEEEVSILRSISVDEPNYVLTEMGSATPEELRQQALDEKKNYKVLKTEGKSEEALRAYKRGKELERQAGALEIYLRKSRKKALPSSNLTEIPKIKDVAKESGRKNKLSPQRSKEKDDLAAELRDLGWSEFELHDADKKPGSVSIEHEISNLLGEVSEKTNTEKGSNIDKSQVIVHKKRALALKREGNLAEAKEELKRAKVLEKQIEEQEFLADAEDSDEELSSLIRSMDVDKQDDLAIGYDAGPSFDLNRLVGIADNIMDSDFEVTDGDMDDPEIAAALNSLGWTEETNHPEDNEPQFVPVDREALLSQIQSLKREALNQKRAGNSSEAMALLKKAKLLERDLDDSESQGTGLMAHNAAMFQKGSVPQSAEKPAKSRLTIQKELLGLKKRALALRREGKLDEAEEELKKGKVLEQQLEETDNASKANVARVNVSHKHTDNSAAPDIGDEDADVTDQDMQDPTYLSLLGNLGWKDEGNENIPSPPSKEDDRSVEIIDASAKGIQVKASRKSKSEIQKELLGLKRKSLALRRQGDADEAEKVLKMARLLETQLTEIETPKKKEILADFSLEKSVDGGDEGALVEQDMHDPALLSMLNNLGWKDEDNAVTVKAKPSEHISTDSVPSDVSTSHYTPEISAAEPKRSKIELQKELLGLKRKALALRRRGETEEAEEALRLANVIEAQLQEAQTPQNPPLYDASKNVVPLITDERHRSLEVVVEINKAAAPPPAGPDNKVVEWPQDLGWNEYGTSKLSNRSSDIPAPESSRMEEDNHQLLVDLVPTREMKTAGDTGVVPPMGQSANIMDLLTGDDWSGSQTSVQTMEDKLNFSSVGYSATNFSVTQNSVDENFGTKDKGKDEKRGEIVNANEKPRTGGSNSAQVTVSQNNQSSLQQDILVHKRKAVALKREGKLAEAKEELRQAKLLEKSMDHENSQPATSSDVVFVEQKEDSSKLPPKPLSSRDRFKLQQESLSHKRQALKLRREGRTEEAEAEFELAKALEAQLEEQQDSTNSSVNAAESVNDVSVEDFLDPQILSALKAIGLEDPSGGSRGPEKPEPVKSIAAGKISEERIQLEQRIKAEKIKALNFKRSGKQAEALDALRRVKLLEKKLNSLAS